MPKKPTRQAFAVVRVDIFFDGETEIDVALENRITVKMIVWSLSQAEAEVDRLNAINKDKGCTYF